MSIDQFISLLATVTFIEMMVTIGLVVTSGEVLAAASDWRLVGRAVLANYVVVPAAAVGLLLLIHAQPMVPAGFLIVAVCPGARAEQTRRRSRRALGGLHGRRNRSSQRRFVEHQVLDVRRRRR